MKRGDFFPARTLFAVNLAFWLSLTLLEILQMYLYSLNFKEPFSWDRQLTFNIPFYISLWLLSFPLYGLFRRVRQIEWPQVLRYYFPASLLFGVLHMLVAICVGMGIKRMMDAPSMEFAEAFALNVQRMSPLIISGFLMFWLMIIILSALNYYRRFKGQSLRAAQLETQLSRSQLHALKMQLHPHFLFNALNTISMMVRRDKDQHAIGMISSLSDLLRQTLSYQEAQFVPFQAELDLLQKYLEIEEVRFQDSLSIHYHIAPETRQVPVPSLLLQPIVENAFKHGISQRMEAGELHISSELQEDELILKVENNGPALPPDWSLDQHTGIGLRNTASRLEQLFGKNFRLEVKNRIPEGVIVEICLPMTSEVATRIQSV